MARLFGILLIKCLGCETLNFGCVSLFHLLKYTIYFLGSGGFPDVNIHTSLILVSHVA